MSPPASPRCSRARSTAAPAISPFSTSRTRPRRRRRAGCGTSAPPSATRGESETVDPVAGHIPGARNAPASGFQDASGRYLHPERIRLHAADLGIASGDATSCGSGITAAQVALALAEAEIPVGVYIGSWSEWIADPTRPVATGDL